MHASDKMQSNRQKKISKKRKERTWYPIKDYSNKVLLIKPKSNRCNVLDKDHDKENDKCKVAKYNTIVTTSESKRSKK